MRKTHRNLLNQKIKRRTIRNSRMLLGRYNEGFGKDQRMVVGL